MTERKADMFAVRKKVEDVSDVVGRLTREIEGLRKDMEQTTGEAKDAYRLVIQDKIRKIENAVVCLSHSVIDKTIYDEAQPSLGELSRLAALSRCVRM